ncbi:MAG: hypothetical protein ACOC16_01410 [Nanoarchaeota archaeon]
MILTKKDILLKTKLDFYKEIKKQQENFKPTKELEGYGVSSIVGERDYPTPKVYNVQSQNKKILFLKQMR